MPTKGFWQSLQSQRISRRRLLVTAGLGAAALGLLTGPAKCGPPVRGGRYKLATTGDWGTIDPLTSVGTATGILPRMYNVLLNRSNTNPDFWFFDLAGSLEQPDHLTYVYKLRRGVKIAPNNLGIPERDMDAFDVLSWDKRVLEDEDALPRVVRLPWVDSVKAPDAQTVIMKTKGPYGYFISRIGRALGGCVPPREFFERGISLADKGVGAGPFVLRPGSYGETGGSSLDANPNYYRIDEARNKRLPYIDGIDVVRISQRQARRTAFVNRQIHYHDAETLSDAEELKRQFPKIDVVKAPVFTFVSFTMNPTRPPWNDERVRKAALYALNRQEFINQIVGPGAGRPNGLVHWPTGRYAFNAQELEGLQPYDPQRSRELIQAATGQGSVRVKVMYPVTDILYHDEHLPIFLSQMKAAGFDIQKHPMDFATWLGDYTRVRYDASLSPNQIYETPEIVLDWQSSKGPQGDGNFAIGIGTLYPEIDQAIMASKRATDPEEQIQKVRQAQRIIYGKGPNFLPIFSWFSYGVNQSFVMNNPNMRGLGDTGTFLNNWWLEL